MRVLLVQHAHALELLSSHMTEGSKVLDVGLGQWLPHCLHGPHGRSSHLTSCMALMVGHHTSLTTCMAPHGRSSLLTSCMALMVEALRYF